MNYKKEISFLYLSTLVFFAATLCAENRASNVAFITPSEEEVSPADEESSEENEPTPYPQASKKQPEEKKYLGQKEKKSGKPPEKYGDCTGESWIGQRVVADRYAGWGWLKREGESWRSAKWIMVEEKPGVILAPQRFYLRPEDDNNMQYRLYGSFASYKGYEPNVDTLTDVFVLKGFEVIGPGSKIERKPPGPSGTRKGRIAEREPF